MSLPTVTLGSLDVSRIGLGAMVLTRAYSEPDLDEARATFEAALDAGVTLIDTADSYGGGENERFIAGLLAGRRQSVVLSSKFGLVPRADGSIVVDGRPERVAGACEASLRRLGVERLDLYYLHRVDPDVPLVETVGAMAALVAAGKVGNLGLCEVSGDELAAANDVHPIAAVQSEWSLWARQLESEVLAEARAAGAALVPYSPLGRGFLTGAVRRPPSGTDLRAPDPRLSGDNLRRNLVLLDVFEKIAGEVGCTPAQLALSWLMHKGQDVVPIPGMETRSILAENLAAVDIHLDPAVVIQLDELFAPGAVAGDADATLLRGADVLGSASLQ